jgi:hypothetical protein
VSWGIGCGNVPGVYADLSQLGAWVQVLHAVSTESVLGIVMCVADGLKNFLCAY